LVEAVIYVAAGTRCSSVAGSTGLVDAWINRSDTRSSNSNAGIAYSPRLIEARINRTCTWRSNANAGIASSTGLINSPITWRGCIGCGKCQTQQGQKEQCFD